MKLCWSTFRFYYSTHPISLPQLDFFTLSRFQRAFQSNPILNFIGRNGLKLFLFISQKPGPLLDQDFFRAFVAKKLHWIKFAIITAVRPSSGLTSLTLHLLKFPFCPWWTNQMKHKLQFSCVSLWCLHHFVLRVMQTNLMWPFWWMIMCFFGLNLWRWKQQECWWKIKASIGRGSQCNMVKVSMQYDKGPSSVFYCQFLSQIK